MRLSKRKFGFYFAIVGMTIIPLFPIAEAVIAMPKQTGTATVGIYGIPGD